MSGGGGYTGAGYYCSDIAWSNNSNCSSPYFTDTTCAYQNTDIFGDCIYHPTGPFGSFYGVTYYNSGPYATVEDCENNCT
mgnify:CR=1 FL=1